LAKPRQNYMYHILGMEQWRLYHILVRWQRSREGAHKLRLIEGETSGSSVQLFLENCLHWRIGRSLAPCLPQNARSPASYHKKDMLLFYFIVLSNFQALLFMYTLDPTRRDYWLLFTFEPCQPSRAYPSFLSIFLSLLSINGRKQLYPLSTSLLFFWA
jgi:hypothetical protein